MVSMFNTLAGALVWGFINNSLNLLGVSAYWQKCSIRRNHYSGSTFEIQSGQSICKKSSKKIFRNISKLRKKNDYGEFIQGGI